MTKAHSPAALDVFGEDPTEHGPTTQGPDDGCPDANLQTPAKIALLHDPTPGRPVALTIIVPTRNEMENVPELLARLGPAVVGQAAEILVVDDSDDETPAVLACHAASSAVPVLLLHRPPGARHGGLSGAVMAGGPPAPGGGGTLL